MARLFPLRRQGLLENGSGWGAKVARAIEPKVTAIRELFSLLVEVLLIRRLNTPDIRAICTLVLVLFTCILASTFAVRLGSRTVFGPNFGADFAGFYIAGLTYNESSARQIYNHEAQRMTYRRLFPDDQTQAYLPFTNAPFLIAPLSQLARLNYTVAYFLWIVCSVGLYLAGFFVIRGALPALPETAPFTALLLALSFMPFLIECVAGGQTSALGFFSLATAIGLERRGWMIASGLALSLCWYEPALLLLILPMLVTTRRIRALDGFLIGTVGLAVVSLWLVGAGGCLDYLRMLHGFAGNHDGLASGYKPWKYVDILSFARNLMGPASSWRVILPVVVLGGVLALLIRFWLGAERKSRNYQSLVWATTLTWTLVANLYIGIYDTTMVVLSALLTAHTFFARRGGPYRLPSEFKIILFLIYVLPWITQPVAQWTGVQVFTLVLALLGGYQFSLLRGAGAAAAISVGGSAEA
jgi:hypothetical protein